MYRLDRLFTDTLNPRGNENGEAFYTQANGDAVWQERYIYQHAIKHIAETSSALTHVIESQRHNGPTAFSRLRLRRKYIWTLQQKRI